MNDWQERDDSNRPPQEPGDDRSVEAAEVAHQETGAEHPQGPLAESPHEQAEALPPATMQNAMDHFLDPQHLYDHVMDSDSFEFPRFLGGTWKVPNPLGYTKEKPMIPYPVAGQPLLTGQLTKFMVLEFGTAIVLCVAFILAARKIRASGAPRGRIANLLEFFVVFVRDEIARPTIGTKDASRFLPFLLTLFMFILTLNLVGILPWLGSVTGSISVTAVLAIATFLVVLWSGVKKQGLVGFAKAQVPHMDLPPAMAIFLVPGIWLIEVFGLLIKHFVLAIRLFANMFGGHLVLAAFLGFVGVASVAGVLGWGIGLGSITFSVLFTGLELFVAALQAYIFTFLAALFIGAALHAH
jgi:F-type H+-transporting ATPase subunit a